MPKEPATSSQEILDRIRRYRKAAALLRKWMAEDDGYDERVWPFLERELGLSVRQRTARKGRTKR